MLGFFFCLGPRRLHREHLCHPRLQRPGAPGACWVSQGCQWWEMHNVMQLSMRHLWHSAFCFAGRSIVLPAFCSPHTFPLLRYRCHDPTSGCGMGPKQSAGQQSGTWTHFWNRGISQIGYVAVTNSTENVYAFSDHLLWFIIHFITLFLDG